MRRKWWMLIMSGFAAQWFGGCRNIMAVIGQTFFA